MLTGLSKAKLHLNNYFDFHVCLSFRPSMYLSVRSSVHPSVRKLALIPAVVSKNDTYKSCLVGVKNEKYAFWVTFNPLVSIRQGKAKLYKVNQATYIQAH